MQEPADSDDPAVLLGRRRFSCIAGVLKKTAAIASYLYGSFARGQQTPLSDVDIAILLPGNSSPEDNGRLALKVSVAIARCIPNVEADVRVLNDLPLETRYRVISEGKPIHCTDCAARARFETAAVMEYLDFKPALDEYDAYLSRVLEETGRL